MASQLGPYGRLYEIDPRLRPTGRSGILATSLAEFVRYFAEGSGQLWERQALCRARVVYGSDEAAQAAHGRRRASGASSSPGSRKMPRALRHMRARLEETSGKGNLKRGPGGLVDIEFLVQMLQLQHAGDESAAARGQHAGCAGALQRSGARWPRTMPQFLAQELSLLADDRGPPAADEHHGPR